MAHVLPKGLARRAATAVLGGAALVLPLCAPAVAHAAYGPPPPPTSPPPGGYRNIVVSETVEPDGGSLGPFYVDGLLVTLRVPRHAFSAAVQITITAPDAAGLGDAGFPRDVALGGVGIIIQLNGSTYPGDFRHDLTLTLTSPRITGADFVVVWNGTQFVIVPSVLEFVDTEVVRFDSESEQDFAVLGPLRVRHRLGGTGAAGDGTVSAAYVAPVTAPASFAMFFRPAEAQPPGLGVLTVRSAARGT